MLLNKESICENVHLVNVNMNNSINNVINTKIPHKRLKFMYSKIDLFIYLSSKKISSLSLQFILNFFKLSKNNQEHKNNLA